MDVPRHYHMKYTNLLKVMTSEFCPQDVPPLLWHDFCFQYHKCSSLQADLEGTKDDQQRESGSQYMIFVTYAHRQICQRCICHC